MSGPVKREGESTAEQRQERLPLSALRRARPLKLWAGAGSNVPCDHCRVLIAPNDVEYEIDAELDGQRVSLHFHHACYSAWNASREGGAASGDEHETSAA